MGIRESCRMSWLFRTEIQVVSTDLWRHWPSPSQRYDPVERVHRPSPNRRDDWHPTGRRTHQSSSRFFSMFSHHRLRSLFNPEYQTFCSSALLAGPAVYETTTLRPMRQKNPELEAESNLFRCMSDASLVKRRRGRGKSATQREKEQRHRFSINGHFYNYKVGSRAKPPSSFFSLRSSLCLSSADLHLHSILRHADQSSHLQPDDHRPGHRATAEQVQGEPLSSQEFFHNGRCLLMCSGQVPDWWSHRYGAASSKTLKVQNKQMSTAFQSWFSQFCRTLFMEKTDF